MEKSRWNMSDKRILALMYDFYNKHILRDQNKDIDYYIDQINKYNAKNILIVGAGTGRVAVPLSKYANIFALDFDSERLEILKTKDEKINTFCCDFKNFNLSKKFDLIIFPYSTIQFGGDKNKINILLKKLNNVMSERTICIFDISESFNNKIEKLNEFLFTDFCNEVQDQVEVYYSSKKYEDYIEFFIEYKLINTKKSVIENEKYLYYDQQLFEKALTQNKLKILKIDDGYGNGILKHKHLYHCNCEKKQ